MKALLFSIGSRGDIEPFLAIAELLNKKGWDVVCFFPEQFRQLAEEDLGYTFYGINKAFMEMLDRPDGKMFMGGEGSPLERFRALREMAKTGIQIQKEVVDSFHQIIKEEQPDRVIYHPKGNISILWGMVNTGKSICVNPIPCMQHPVKHLSPITFRGNKNYGQPLNLMAYWFLNTIKAHTIKRFTKKYHKDYPTLKISAKAINRAHLREEKTIYTISPSLFPRPDYWPNVAQVVGFHERTKTLNWQPDEALENFIAEHKKIVFITFGSMSSSKSKQKTEAIISVLAKHKIPAIINTSWGGLTKPETYPNHIYFVNNIPYDWVFPKVYAVVHHGGSGTTHTAFKYGCPSLLVPHFIDQFYWNKVVAKVGAGPLGVSIKKLNSANFEMRLLNLLNNESFKKKAESIAAKMELESDKERLFKLICQ